MRGLGIIWSALDRSNFVEPHGAVAHRQRLLGKHGVYQFMGGVGNAKSSVSPRRDRPYLAT
jgi:hypothetical protein